MSITRLYRLLQLITLLRSGRRYDADALAEELAVSRRTVFRDLHILTAAEIPYYYDSEADAYAIDRSFFLPAVNLTLDEALALFLANRKMIGELPLPMFQQASQAAVKLESSLPRAIQQHCGSIMDRFEVRFPAWSGGDRLEETFHQLRLAIEQQRKVLLHYESLTETGNRSPRVARNVAEVQWHHTQRCEFRPEGRLHFSVTVDELNEISWWILGYGDQVKVLAPAKLARLIKTAAANVVRLYDEARDESDRPESQ